MNTSPSLPRRARDDSAKTGIRKKKEKLSKSCIPVWCSIRDNNLTITSRHKAKYVLAHISYYNETDMAGHGVHRIGRHNYSAKAVKCDDFWLYYVKVDAEVLTLPSLIRRALSAAYSQVDGYDYSEPTGARYLRRAFRVDRNEIAHHRIGEGPQVGEFERSLVSAEHHTHYRPEEIWRVVQAYPVTKRAVDIVYRKLKKIEGVNEAIVSTFMMFTAFARPQVAYILATSAEIWEASNVGQLMENLKKVSTPLKSMQNPQLCDMTQLFELQALVNRGVGKVDWQAEKMDRTKPDVVEVASERVYEEALKIFRSGAELGFRYPKMDVDRYVKSRWEWVPTGSVHSQYAEDEPYIKKDYRHRTKFVTLNKMAKDRIRRMFSRPAEIHAWASVKYEWAKQRAIYGVDLTSSVITNLAMFRCEDVFKHRFPVGEEAEAGRVHKRLTAMLKDNESFCYDFDNFNAQHSKESMQAVLLAYLDTFKDDMTEDQKRAMWWTIASVNRMIVHNNEVKNPETYEAAGTLLSGWRLTTFVNTALNYVYFKIAGALDAEGVKDSVHNGDDVLVAIRTVGAATVIHKLMADINARAQATKCNVFSVGEFLRVEHKVTKEDGLGAQYLSRAAATMTHSRIESQQPVRVTDAVKAMVTRAEEIAARSKGGAEMAKEMLDIACVRLAKVFGVDREDTRRIARSHVLVGGAIAAEVGEIDYTIEEEVEYIEVGRTEEEKKKVAQTDELLPGILDYAGELEKQFGKYLDRERIVKRITDATKRQLAVTRRTRLTITDVKSEIKYKFGRALFRMYRGLISVPHVDKARFLGITPIAMLDSGKVKQLYKMIEHVKDVEYALRVLL